MFATIFFAVFVLFANEGNALKSESICCEEIKSLLENKTVAYQTVCVGTERRLSRNCCKNIENEIEKHRYAYKTLCSEVEKPVTTAIPTTAYEMYRHRTKYVNIRGHQCSDCDIPWWQISGSYIFHTDSSYTSCGFNPASGSVSNEDNFGYYYNINPNFRCTSDPSATTNWWFGGNVA